MKRSYSNDIQVERLVGELLAMLKNEKYYQFKFRFDSDGKITIIPHAQAVTVTP